MVDDPARSGRAGGQHPAALVERAHAFPASRCAAQRAAPRHRIHHRRIIPVAQHETASRVPSSLRTIHVPRYITGTPGGDAVDPTSQPRSNATARCDSIIRWQAWHTANPFDARFTTRLWVPPRPRGRR